MEPYIVDRIIEFGNMAGGEVLSCMLLVFCYILILLLWKFFSIHGLYLYNVVVIIAANIQVLKTTPFFLSPEPVALGTLIFATTFLVSDIITEHHGLAPARRGIMLSFLAQVLMTIFMIITMAYPYNPNENIINDSALVQFGLYILFAPSLRLLIASLTSYCISQWLDIQIFKMLKDRTRKKLLWLRLNVSTLVAGFVDNIIFSLLAWVILSPNPVSLSALIFTYVLGTYGARVVVSITSTPVIYLTYKFQPNKKT